MVSFDYNYAPVSDLHAVTTVDSKTGKSKIEGIELGGDIYKPTERFWTSLFARFGFNKSFFKYFEPQEVFERISDKESSDRMRICIEKNDKGENRLLAVSNPNKPVMMYDDLMGLLETYGAEKISYSNGIIESTQTPRVGANNFDIGGDAFANKFLLSSPIDGYGLPNVYLMMLRQICSNGMVGMSRAFRSSVNLGRGDDNVAFALTRVLDQFSNDEGYAALRSRVESATNSWASVKETQTLYKHLIRLLNAKQILRDKQADQSTPIIDQMLSRSEDTENYLPMGSVDQHHNVPILHAFHNMTGDASRLYGLANIDALSDKRQGTLPTKCTVYDLINFGTEVATHYAKTDGARKLQSWVGTLLTSEYDLEGTKQEFSDFADFHITNSPALAN